MPVFELVVALLIAGALLSVLADRIGVPGPTLLAVAGAAVALLPGIPAVELDPDLALALFVAPILVKAGRDVSLRDLRDHWVPVLTLVVNLVVLTAAAVAVIAHALLPDLPWSAAIALGAIVAPPDASAAAPVLRRLSPPHRAQVILEGESLLNDASALLLFRLALVANAGDVQLSRAVPFFLLTTLAGIVLGGGLAWALMRLRARAHETADVVVFQFVTAFAVWLLAERLQVSAILTVATFAIAFGRFAPRRLPPQQRILAAGVWDVAVHVLTVLAFILTGLQLQTVLSRLDGQWGPFFGLAGAVAATVVLVRLVWVMGWSSVIIAKNRLLGPSLRRDDIAAPDFRTALFVAWSGMRGVVTLATALALPDGFPHRDLLVFAAFSVVLVTLVLQGATVGPLLRWMRIDDDSAVLRETALARAETARAALACLHASQTGPDQPGPAAAALRRDFEDRLHRAESPDDEEHAAPELAALRARVLLAERAALDRLRESDRIGDAAFRTLEEELDWSEVIATRRIERT